MKKGEKGCCKAEMPMEKFMKGAPKAGKASKRKAKR